MFKNDQDQLSLAGEQAERKDHLPSNRRGLGYSKALIAQEAGNVSDIAYPYGFSDPTNFARAFKAQFGVSPESVPGGGGSSDGREVWGN